MPRKKSPITDYAFEEEEEEVGRILGAVAKQDRGVYEQFKRQAALRGLKTTEAAIEAFKLWNLSRNIRAVDPDALIAAIDFINYMEEASIKKLLALGKLFTSEFFRVQMGIAKEVAEKTAPPEQETKPPNPEEALKQQLKFQMINTMIPLYMGIMQQLLKALGNVNIPTQNILPTQTQTTQKKPIIIEE